MIPTWTAVVLASIGALGTGGGLYSAFTVGATRRKMLIDAAAVNASTTTVLGGYAVDVLLKPLRERVHELEDEVKALRDTVRRVNNLLDEREETIRKLRQVERRTADPDRGDMPPA